jgi:hypothetical protein
MKISDQKEDQENDGLMVYLRLWETLQLKRPTEEQDTANCLSPQRWEAIEEGKKKKKMLSPTVVTMLSR